MRHWAKALLGVAVTVLLLWWALSDVTFSEVWTHVRTADPWLLLAAIGVATSGFLVRALRWKVLLDPVKADTHLRSRFASVAIGFMANNVLPARVGEFARAYAFSRLEPVSASAAFGTLVVERFLDGVVLLLFLVLPIVSPGFPSEVAFSGGAGSAVLSAGIGTVAVVLVALVLMALWPESFVRVAERLFVMLPRSMERPALAGLEAFLGSIAIVRDARLLALAFAWSVFFWAWHGISFWLGMLAFGIDTGFVSAIFTEALVGFGVALPSAPGFFGTFHFAANIALSEVYGVPEAQSLAFAFGYHLGGWIPITSIGLWYAWSLGLSIREMGAAEEQVEVATVESEQERGGACAPQA